MVSEEVDEGETEIMEFAWVNHDRRHIIATIEYIEGGIYFLRQIWHQVNPDVSTEAHILDLDTTKYLE